MQAAELEQSCAHLFLLLPLPHRVSSCLSPVTPVLALMDEENSRHTGVNRSSVELPSLA